jgi:hypothetical protein
MQNHPIRLLLLALVTFANPAVVYAHDQNGTLGPDSSASDYYQIICSDDGNGPTNHLEIEMLSTTKGLPVVSLQIVTQVVSTAQPLSIYNITDAVSGDSTPSRTVQVANVQTDPDLGYTNAEGSYYVSVNKTQAGIQSYHFTYHCTSDTAHTGSEIITLQNQ